MTTAELLRDFFGDEGAARLGQAVGLGTGEAGRVLREGLPRQVEALARHAQAPEGPGQIGEALTHLPRFASVEAALAERDGAANLQQAGELLAPPLLAGQMNGIARQVAGDADPAAVRRLLHLSLPLLLSFLGQRGLNAANAATLLPGLLNGAADEPVSTTVIAAVPEIVLGGPPPQEAVSETVIAAVPEVVLVPPGPPPDPVVPAAVVTTTRRRGFPWWPIPLLLLVGLGGCYLLQTRPRPATTAVVGGATGGANTPATDEMSGGANLPATGGADGETNAPAVGGAVDATTSPGEGGAAGGTGGTVTPGEAGTTGGANPSTAGGTTGGTNTPATGEPNEGADAPTQGGTNAPAADGAAGGTTTPGEGGTPGGANPPAAGETDDGTNAPAAGGATDGTNATGEDGTTGGTDTPGDTGTTGAASPPAAGGTTGQANTPEVGGAADGTNTPAEGGTAEEAGTPEAEGTTPPATSGTTGGTNTPARGGTGRGSNTPAGVGAAGAANTPDRAGVTITEPEPGAQVPAGGFSMRGTGPAGETLELYRGDERVGDFPVGEDGTWETDVVGGATAPGQQTYTLRTPGGGEVAATLPVTVVAACTDALALDPGDGERVSAPFRLGGRGSAGGYTVTVRRGERVVGQRRVTLNPDCTWSYRSDPGGRRGDESRVTYEVGPTDATAGEPQVRATLTVSGSGTNFNEAGEYVGPTRRPSGGR